MRRQTMSQKIGSRSLEVLRTPLEDGEVRLARDGVACYPARASSWCPAVPCERLGGSAALYLYMTDAVDDLRPLGGLFRTVLSIS
jgi:hypothetical protein